MTILLMTLLLFIDCISIWPVILVLFVPMHCCCCCSSRHSCLLTLHYVLYHCWILYSLCYCFYLWTNSDGEAFCYYCSMVLLMSLLLFCVTMYDVIRCLCIVCAFCGTIIHWRDTFDDDLLYDIHSIPLLFFICIDTFILLMTFCYDGIPVIPMMYFILLMMFIVVLIRWWPIHSPDLVLHSVCWKVMMIQSVRCWKWWSRTSQTWSNWTQTRCCCCSFSSVVVDTIYCCCCLLYIVVI